MHRGVADFFERVEHALPDATHHDDRSRARDRSSRAAYAERRDDVRIRLQAVASARRYNRSIEPIDVAASFGSRHFFAALSCDAALSALSA